MLDLEIRHLKLLDAVAEQGSLTKAAEQLYRTQSALSHQLKEMETRLGAPLFHRVNKKMILTPHGERMLRSARVILTELAEAEADILSSLQGKSGKVRLSTECYTCYHWLPPLLKQFKESYPRVDLQIVAEATRDPLPYLLEGQLDVALVQKKSPHPQLHYYPLFTDEVMFLLPPGHHLRNRPFIRPQDVASENYLIYTHSLDNNTLYKEFLKPAQVVPRQVTHIGLTEAIVEMVKAGLGVSALARWAVQSHIHPDRLLMKPIGEKGFHRQWYLATLRQENPPVYLNCFLRQMNKVSFSQVTEGSLPGSLLPSSANPL